MDKTELDKIIVKLDRLHDKQKVMRNEMINRQLDRMKSRMEKIKKDFKEDLDSMNKIHVKKIEMLKKTFTKTNK